MLPKIGQKWKHKYHGYTAVVVKLYRIAAVMYKLDGRDIVVSDTIKNFLEYFELVEDCMYDSCCIHKTKEPL